MLYTNHKKSAKTALVSFCILLITLVLISNKIYSDIRGEFAKRPTALPPEPAAVVDYLKEDFSNLRAESSKECFPGKVIRADLRQLGATPTFFEAIDLALRNAGLSGFTSRDFLPLQPDSVSSSTETTYDSNLYYACNGTGTTKILIDQFSTTINLALTPSSSQPDLTCSSIYGVSGGICTVLSNCGSSVNGVWVGGCLATSNDPSNLQNISGSLNPNIIIETLTGCIPRRNPYFSNPAVGSSSGNYTLLSNKVNPTGNVIGCSNPTLSNGACASADSTPINGTNSLFSINSILTSASTATTALIKVPRQQYILAFKILTCPSS